MCSRGRNDDSLLACSPASLGPLQDLGTAALTRRPTSVVLVLPPSAATGPLVKKDGEQPDDPKQVESEFLDVQKKTNDLLTEWLQSKDL